MPAVQSQPRSEFSGAQAIGAALPAWPVCKTSSQSRTQIVALGPSLFVPNTLIVLLPRNSAFAFAVLCSGLK